MISNSNLKSFSATCKLTLAHICGDDSWECKALEQIYFDDTFRWKVTGTLSYLLTIFFLSLGHGAGQPPCPLVLPSYALDTVRGNPRVHLYFLPTPWTRCGATPVSTCTSSYALDTVRGNPRVHLYFFLRLGHGAGQPPCPPILFLRSWLVSPGKGPIRCPSDSGVWYA